MVRLNNSGRGSLVVVGTGIRLVGQTTLEAVACMEKAEKLLYVVTEPATETWIKRLNPTATTLADCYAEGKSRSKTYQEMTQRIAVAVRSGLQVCAVFYGHPGVLVNASHQAIRRLRREGYSAQMLPGISAEDCLFADLGVNPGENGCQSFEATDFLAARRRFDPSSELILWQVGALGEGSVRKGMFCRPERLKVLTNVLRRHYPRRHPVVIYEASSFPTCPPTITRVRLDELSETQIPAMTTLYVAARAQRRPDEKIMRWLDEK
jgi:precorrin-3B methylase